jgi:tripartite-type tricarboxylate transporter receptor subunit TctC
VIGKLNAAFVAAANDPAVRSKIEDSGLTVITSSPQEMQKMMADDTVDIIELVRALGLKTQ